MHGNVGEWVWEWYGAYDAAQDTDPADALRVNPGGGWNDFAKNLRSAYRATLPQYGASLSVGLQVVRSASPGSWTVDSAVETVETSGDGTVLIAYFS